MQRRPFHHEQQKSYQPFSYNELLKDFRYKTLDDVASTQYTAQELEEWGFAECAALLKKHPDIRLLSFYIILRKQLIIRAYQLTNAQGKALYFEDLYYATHHDGGSISISFPKIAKKTAQENEAKIKKSLSKTFFTLPEEYSDDDDLPPIFIHYEKVDSFWEQTILRFQQIAHLPFAEELQWTPPKKEIVYRSPRILPSFINPLTTSIISDAAFTQTGAKGLASLIIRETWRVVMQDNTIKNYTSSLNQVTQSDSEIIHFINESIHSYLVMFGKNKQDMIDKVIENCKNNKRIASDSTFETIFKKALILTFTNLKNLYPDESGACKHPPCLPRLSSISDNLREKVSKRKLMQSQTNYLRLNLLTTKNTEIKTDILHTIKNILSLKK